MDSTFLRAGRNTHLKIVGVAAAAVVIVLAVGLGARTGHFATAQGPSGGAVVKAGQSATLAKQETTGIR